jgi:GNAT superfamily N-acetyltransferase
MNGEIAIRPLEPADIRSLVTLHQDILGTNHHAHVLRRDDVSKFQENLVRPNITFGAFADDDLVGYAAIAFGVDATRYLIPFAGEPTLQPERAALHDGSGVHPRWRGRGLQTQLNHQRIATAAAAGCTDVVGTVSTHNPFSLSNHLKLGFVVRGAALLYSGMERLVIRMRLSEEQPQPSSMVGCRVPLSDWASLERRLAAGYVGVACEGGILLLVQ